MAVAAPEGMDADGAISEVDIIRFDGRGFTYSDPGTPQKADEEVDVCFVVFGTVGENPANFLTGKVSGEFFVDQRCSPGIERGFCRWHEASSFLKKKYLYQRYYQ